MKKVIVFALCGFLVFGMCGCGTRSDDKTNEIGNVSPFVEVYRGSDVHIFVDKETKVQYAMVNNGHGGTGFQPLYNADGTFKLYKGED